MRDPTFLGPAKAPLPRTAARSDETGIGPKPRESGNGDVCEERAKPY
jgi:hypothetical protein